MEKKWIETINSSYFFLLSLGKLHWFVSFSSTKLLPHAWEVDLESGYRNLAPKNGPPGLRVSVMTWTDRYMIHGTNYSIIVGDWWNVTIFQHGLFRMKDCMLDVCMGVNLKGC